MSCRLRLDQCCAEDGCTRPARYADLCTAHYLTADPAVRACADMLDRLDTLLVRKHLELLADALQPTTPLDPGALAECCELEDLYEMPAYDGRRAA